MLRPELETIDMVRAERDSATAELELMRARLHALPADWQRTRSVLMQQLGACAVASHRHARLTPEEAKKLLTAFDAVSEAVQQLAQQRDQARLDVMRCREALECCVEQLGVCGHVRASCAGTPGPGEACGDDYCANCGEPACDYCADALELATESLEATKAYS